MTYIRATATVALALTALFGVSACSAFDPLAEPPADAPAAEAPSSDGADTNDEAGTNDNGDAADDGDNDSYAQRLTPVAMAKNATDIRIEGNDAWVTVPVASTSASSILECLQLLPARADGETLTVIFSDGVEELCEWE